MAVAGGGRAQTFIEEDLSLREKFVLHVSDQFPADEGTHLAFHVDEELVARERLLQNLNLLLTPKVARSLEQLNDSLTREVYIFFSLPIFLIYLKTELEEGALGSTQSAYGSARTLPHV